VGVVQCDRPGWDAELVAHAAGDGFVVVPATVLRHADERWIPDADFASRHDDDARLGWLAERLREALGRMSTRPKALLLPPSLGVESARADSLSGLVGVPCGEATGVPSGPAGLRFERARNRALSAAGVTVVAARASSIERAAGRWHVRLEDERELDADAAVIATGGLVGGGLEYQPSDAMLAAALPPAARPAFRCTVEGPLPLGAHGRPIDLPGSLFGVAPESIAWPLSHDRTMEHVGVLAGESGRVTPGLYVAGELVADAPRTWLCALSAGTSAGTSAARDAVRALPARPASRGEAPASRP
jgi:glycerol-3-phosphate dehydrogenase subunit B